MIAVCLREIVYCTVYSLAEYVCTSATHRAIRIRINDIGRIKFCLFMFFIRIGFQWHFTA